MIINLTTNKLGYKMEKEIKQKFANMKIYVSHGWIDAHIHIFNQSLYNLSHNKKHAIRGLVAAIDAGSSGVLNFKEAWANNQNLPFKMFYFLNVAPSGLTKYLEIQEKTIYPHKIDHLMNQYHEILGLKMRFSKQAIGTNNNYKHILKELQTSHHKVMYHIGNSPPSLEELTAIIKDGDIITHFAHNKNNDFLNYIIKSHRQIDLDIGFGNESLSINRLQKFIKNKIYPTSISTDLHDLSWNNTSCRIERLIEVMLELNFTIAAAIKLVTLNPYEKYITKNKYPDYYQTFTIFTIKDQKGVFIDSEQEELVTNQKINVLGIYNKKIKWY